MTNKTIIRIIAYIAGLIIQALGLALMIRSDLGTGPWDGFYVGMCSHFGLTVGFWLIIFGVIFIFCSSYLMKRRPDFLSLITVIILGLCIDVWLYVIHPEQKGAEMQVFTFWLGLIITSAGTGMYLQGEFALTPADQLMIALCRRLGLSLTASKTIGDSCALAFALVLDGPIGLGTVIYTFLSGPLIQFLIPRIERAIVTHVKD
ncbi:YitT family protein [Paenactinomyces guangxiensis]|uniref:YitT family protein n=1 Tax=Paenactinomyces guangxiensis TaxID=1490290 RepID=A0A7W2A8H4_9BACL|nr:YitT family protein [Paenactinomyces guangxiensis]MBA4494179.1 YitT family protein [Paenactinomyces guangxiensis]MBH8590675.1 YitT family protein [Paenactinomyces guangxiensis]